MSRIPGPRTPLDIIRLARDLRRDPARTLTRAHATYGPVSKVDLRPYELVVLLLGPEANEYVLATNPTVFRRHGARGVLEPIEGTTSLMVSHGDDHARRCKVGQPPFQKGAIDGHLDHLLEEADRTIDRWAPGAAIDGYGAAATAIERMTIMSVGGPGLRARANEIATRLAPAIAFVDRRRLPPFRVPVPSMRAHRARTGRRLVDAIIDEEIDRRRGRPRGTGRGPSGGTPDLFTRLVDAEGHTLSRPEIRDQVVSAIANYHTTAAAMGWALHRLVTEAEVWARTAAELDLVVGDRRLALADLAHLPYLDGVVHETLRLHPPSACSARRVAEPITFHGARIPRGTTVLFSPSLAARDPAQFPDPERFRPERWDRTRPDHVAPHPFAFVPFGGGARPCIGTALATLQLKVLIAQIVRRTELIAARARPPHPEGSVAIRPVDGVPIRVLSVRPAMVLARTEAHAPPTTPAAATIEAARA